MGHSFLGADNWGSRVEQAIKAAPAPAPQGKPFEFIGNCASLDPRLLGDMIEHAEEVNYDEMAKHCDLRPFEDKLDYEQDPANGLTLKEDYHVSYFKSHYDGTPCYYHTHSSFEWVWVLR